MNSHNRPVHSMSWEEYRLQGSARLKAGHLKCACCGSMFKCDCTPDHFRSTRIEVPKTYIRKD